MNRSTLVIALVAVLALVAGSRAANPTGKYAIQVQNNYKCAVTVTYTLSQVGSNSFNVNAGRQSGQNTDFLIGDMDNAVKSVLVEAPAGNCNPPLNNNQWTGPSLNPKTNVAISADGSVNIQAA